MISVANLTRSFGNFTAVDNLSFEVKPGDVVGFLGPNGAGKSTTMKMLTGFLTPTGGDITINQLPMSSQRKAIQRNIGYLPEGAPAYSDMTVLQFLRFIADVRGLRGKDKKRHMQRVVDELSLNEMLNRPIEHLSKGFKRRVGLAQALIHDPQILILDEPTDGLDPNQKHQVRELITQLSEDKLVIISTHILEEVSAVCNRAMIIANGQLKFDGTPVSLRQQSRYHKAVSVHFEHMIDISGLTSLLCVDDFEVDKQSGRVTLFAHNQQDILPQVSHYIQDHGLPVDTLYLEQGRMDDVFRQLTQGGQP